MGFVLMIVIKMGVLLWTYLHLHYCNSLHFIVPADQLFFKLEIRNTQSNDGALGWAIALVREQYSQLKQIAADAVVFNKAC